MVSSNSEEPSLTFPEPIDLAAIEERFSEAFVAGRWFPEGHECQPYVRLANDVQPLLREVKELRAEVERSRDYARAQEEGWRQSTFEVERLRAALQIALAWYEPRLSPFEEGRICNVMRGALTSQEAFQQARARLDDG
jgi:hypothetical protein